MAALAAVASLDVPSPSPSPEPATQANVPHQQNSTDEEEQAQQLSTLMERVSTPFLEQQLSESCLSCLAIVTRVVISKFSTHRAYTGVISGTRRRNKNAIDELVEHLSTTIGTWYFEYYQRSIVNHSGKRVKQPTYYTQEFAKVPPRPMHRYWTLKATTPRCVYIYLASTFSRSEFRPALPSEKQFNLITWEIFTSYLDAWLCSVFVFGATYLYRAFLMGSRLKLCAMNSGLSLGTSSL